MQKRSRVVPFFLLTTLWICFSFVPIGFGQSLKLNMNKSELADAAVVLQALTRDWNLVDYNPDHDFLVLVNESREELDFYPKRSFISRLEQEGLIEDVDKRRSSVREPTKGYEREGDGWKEITTEGIIVFQHRVTQKGQNFLRDLPKSAGSQIRPLKVARNPVDIEVKVIREVTYDRAAIKKLVETHDQKAKELIRNAFSNESSSTSRVVCGPKLWQILQPHAQSNGLQPKASLVREDLSFNGEGAKRTSLSDQLIMGPAESRLFWKTLREQFKFTDQLTIRRATSAERSADTYSVKLPPGFQIPGKDDEFPPPNLMGYEALFVVEVNGTRFIVLIENEPDDQMKHSAPHLKWIEIIS